MALTDGQLNAMRMVDQTMEALLRVRALLMFNLIEIQGEEFDGDVFSIYQGIDLQLGDILETHYDLMVRTGLDEG